VTGIWEFRFKRTELMERHRNHPDRLAVLHRVDGSWTPTLEEALG
jgi:hypothetical protein